MIITKGLGSSLLLTQGMGKFLRVFTVFWVKINTAKSYISSKIRGRKY